MLKNKVHCDHYHDNFKCHHNNHYNLTQYVYNLINTNHPDQLNPKHYKQRRWFFSKTSWKTPISLPKCLVWPWSGRQVLACGKRP